MSLSRISKLQLQFAPVPAALTAPKCRITRCSTANEELMQLTHRGGCIPRLFWATRRQATEPKMRSSVPLLALPCSALGIWLPDNTCESSFFL